MTAEGPPSPAPDTGVLKTVKNIIAGKRERRRGQSTVAANLAGRLRRAARASGFDAALLGPRAFPFS
jgi:hypothetical protein